VVVFGDLNLVSLSGFLAYLLEKSGLMFKSPLATLLPTPTLQQLMPRGRHACRVMPYLSVLIRFHVMHSKHLS